MNPQTNQPPVEEESLVGLVQQLSAEDYDYLCQEVFEDASYVDSTTVESEPYVLTVDPLDSGYIKRKRESGMNCIQMVRDGPLPLGITWVALTSGLIPILEDQISGVIHYHSFTRDKGFTTLSFSGPCPLHKGRIHDGGAKFWQLKIKRGLDGYAGFKCWKDDLFDKIPFGIPELDV